MVGYFDATKPGEQDIQVSNGKIVGSESALNLDVVRPDSDEDNLLSLSIFMEEIIKQVMHRKLGEILLSMILMLFMYRLIIV